MCALTNGLFTHNRWGHCSSIKVSNQLTYTDDLFTVKSCVQPVTLFGWAYKNQCATLFEYFEFSVFPTHCPIILLRLESQSDLLFYPYRREEMNMIPKCDMKCKQLHPEFELGRVFFFFFLTVTITPTLPPHS